MCQLTTGAVAMFMTTVSPLDPVCVVPLVATISPPPGVFQIPWMELSTHVPGCSGFHCAPHAVLMVVRIAARSVALRADAVSCNHMISAKLKPLCVPRKTTRTVSSGGAGRVPSGTDRTLPNRRLRCHSGHCETGPVKERPYCVTCLPLQSCETECGRIVSVAG